MSGGFLRGGMKKQSGMKHAGLLHPIGAQCPGSPPCCTNDLRSSIGTCPVIRRRASNPAPGDNDTQSNFGCSR